MHAPTACGPDALPGGPLSSMPAAARPTHAGGQFVLLGTGHADGGLRRMAEQQYK